jgi:hypothetical protein
MLRTGVVLVLAGFCGLALLAPRAVAEDDKTPAVLDAKPMEPTKGDDELHKLLKERYNAALEEVQVRYKQILAGTSNLDELARAGRRLLHARLELCEKAPERVPVYEQQLELARMVEKIQKARHDAGQVSVADWDHARYERLDLEIQLLHAKKAAGAKPKE